MSVACGQSEERATARYAGGGKGDGIRPCKRCNPDGSSTDEEYVAIVARACRMIECSQDELSLATLACQSGLSSSYFHCVFKGVTV